MQRMEDLVSENVLGIFHANSFDCDVLPWQAQFQSFAIPDFIHKRFSYKPITSIRLRSKDERKPCSMQYPHLIAFAKRPWSSAHIATSCPEHPPHLPATLIERDK
jgi:hypothetical protein